MVLALPDDHRPAGSGEVSLDQLNDQPFVMYAPVESRYHRGLLTGLFRSCDLRPRFVQYARETHAILALIGTGIGMAIVPQNAVRLRPHNVTVVGRKQAKPIHSELTLAWLWRHGNPALEAFCRLAKDEIAPTS